MKKSNRKSPARASKASKKVAAAPVAKVAKKSESRTPLKVAIADLAITPKAARVILRRAWRKTDEENVTFHERGARWDLTPAQVKEVRAILGA